MDRHEPRQLRTERERAILREVVESHIATGEAVGSKLVAARMSHRLSSASIRAVMSDLGRQGLLQKPHTSAGRVPTDQGWRVYLDELVTPRDLGPDDIEGLTRLAWREGSSALDVMREAAHALSETMACATLVCAPRLESAVLHRLELVWLGPKRVLAIAVTRGGLVHERLLHVGEEVTRGQLETFTNYLNTLLPGRSLPEIRALIAEELARDEAAQDGLSTAALALGRRTFEGAGGGDAEMILDGASRVLEQPEFGEARLAADLMRTLEERESWLGLLDRIVGAEDVEIYVGAETGRPALAPCAVMTAGYRSGHGTGIVVLVGPKRLDYGRAISLVSVVACRLSSALDGEDSTMH